MSSKIVSAAVVASVLAVMSAPVVANAEDAAPKTKAECLKTKDMHWDKKTNACVKK